MDFEQYRFHHQSILNDYPTNIESEFDEQELKARRNDTWDELADYQERLYAESKQSLLIVLQAMDAAGKDSTIAKLTTPLNAQGCKVSSFKKPTKRELAQDFLWRVHSQAPSQGEITVFNRSHYEDVLIVKVHGWVSDQTINSRYEHINNFESLLADRGTRVIKFMLNISRDYQLERFRRRLEQADKHWKFNPEDLSERQHWDDYMDAFEKAMRRCSSAEAPWYVVPAENRRMRDLMIASVILKNLKEMDPKYPEPNFDTEKFTADSIS